MTIKPEMVDALHKAAGFADDQARQHGGQPWGKASPEALAWEDMANQLHQILNGIAGVAGAAGVSAQR